MYANTYSRMAVIARDKLTGFGEHWGILLPTGYVAHNTDERNTHVVTFEEFAAGSGNASVAAAKAAAAFLRGATGVCAGHRSGLRVPGRRGRRLGCCKA